MEDEHKKYEVSARVRMLDPILLDSCLMYAYGGYQNQASKMMAETIGYVGRNKTNVTVTNLTNLQFTLFGGNRETRTLDLTDVNRAL